MARDSLYILEMLLKTNRPPTNEERAIILDSMAPTNAKLKVVEEKISEIKSHIKELKSQVRQAEAKLRPLLEEEAGILETFADHRRALSPFRNLPDDVLREICVACVQDDVPELSFDRIPMPYLLAQICTGMRHIALTTPVLWASMMVVIRPISSRSSKVYEQMYENLARLANEWFQRAGGLGLTVIIHDARYIYTPYELNANSDPTTILFGTLLSYSTRWKEIQFTSYTDTLPTSMIRILTATNVPLQSVSLRFEDSISHPMLQESKLLETPTLRHVTLKNALSVFTVNWAVLTSVTLCGNTAIDIGRILQQTRSLEFCNITVHSGDHYSGNIDLPFLKTLVINEKIGNTNSSGRSSILEAITAPILEIFETRGQIFNLSLSDFPKRFPQIYKFSILYLDKDKLLIEAIEFLRHFPSLSILSLRPNGLCRGTRDAQADQFLRSFVEEGNDGVMCPRLQDFTFLGPIGFSLETLRIFLEGKQADISPLNVSPWRRVVISTDGIMSAEARKQISDLVGQKKSAGLNVTIRS